MPLDCKHLPKCPASTTRWRCARRTETERAVTDGWITRDAAERLLAAYGMPMTPERNVLKVGRLAKPLTQQKLV